MCAVVLLTGVIFLVTTIVFLIWLFRPAISSWQNVASSKKKNTLYDSSGVIEADNQIHEHAKCDISLVVPAYNEELRLVPMLDETIKFMSLWSARASLSYEIMVVDDGSSDNTVEVVRGYMAKKESCVKLLVLGSNRGKGGAVKCGVQRATGRHILMVDADAATDIADLEKVYSRLREAEVPGVGMFDLASRPVGMAVGSRAHMAEDSVASRSLLRTVLMKGFHFLVMLLISRNVEDTQCGFKLFSRETARTLFQLLHLEKWSFDVELIFLAESFGMPIVEVPVNWHEVDGSKLIQSKWDIATTSLTMARDMLCVRLCYTLGFWSCNRDEVKRSLSEKKSQ